MKRLCSMREALTDPQLFGAVLPGESWANWRIMLIASQGEPLTAEEREMFTALTGREREPDEPVDEFWGVCGRGAGKTRAFSVAASYYAACIDHSGGNLAPGQRYRLPVMATKAGTAKEAFNYLLGIITEVPEFADLLDGEPTQDTIRLTNRVDVMVTPASFKTVRGPTFVAAVLDEIAFWHIDGAANPDKEVLRAVRPGLSRVGGPLFVLSSPYAKKGELYATYKRHFGPAGDPRILVMQAPTLTMHHSPTIEREVVRAYERDPEAARAEYGAQFREGISDYITQDVVDACTDVGVTRREPEQSMIYVGFVDASSGSGSDAMTLAIGHRDRATQLAVLDVVEGVPPPYSPEAVVAQFVAVLKRFRVSKVTGDNFAGEWLREMMGKHGIACARSPKVKNQIYGEFVALLNSRQTRLLDHPRMLGELLALERRTAQGGRDVVDHPSGGHDDYINSAAGVLVEIGLKPVSVMDLL